MGVGGRCGVWGTHVGRAVRRRPSGWLRAVRLLRARVFWAHSWGRATPDVLLPGPVQPLDPEREALSPAVPPEPSEKA